jgi:hypothetical protein
MDLDEKRQLIPEEDVQKYLSNMSEIRFRISNVRQNLNVKSFDVISFESALLQIRKSLELIAFSSLVSNKDGYESVRGSIEKDWHAVRILKAVEAVNPDFYPVPVDPDDDSVLASLYSGFLTKAEFIKWYNLCGEHMHARNPFIEEQSKSDILALIPELIAKLELLLQEHLISLSGSDDKIWISVEFEDKTKPVAMRFLHHLHEQT